MKEIKVLCVIVFSLMYLLIWNGAYNQQETTVINRTITTTTLGTFKAQNEQHLDCLSTIIETPLKRKIEFLYDVDNSAKTYMCYNKITNEGSEQYQYINNSGEITIDEKGFLVTEDGYVGVAMGSYFGDIGTKYEIVLDTGIVLKVVKVEAKADVDTCENNYMSYANDIIEFVIDTNSEYMQSNIKENGYIFWGNFNNTEEYNGDIVEIYEVA